MPFVPFDELCEGVAHRETRFITVMADDGPVPKGEYGLYESYCDEPGCDCRRVLFYVVARSRPGVQAVIGWGWEDVDFYARWLGSGDKSEAARVKGPEINPLSPATELAPALLRVVRDILLRDPEYVERIKRHYRMFRATIDRPRKPPRRRARKDGPYRAA